ncbi:MAG: ATP synthase F1 subunit delta [Gemmatimonadota bacterium]
MSGSAIAENYAEALFELAQKSGQLEAYGAFLEATAAAVESTPQLQSVLMSPRVTKARKAEVLAKSLGQAGAPREFQLYLQAVVKRNRQAMFGDIARAYGDLVDRNFNRVRASVVLAREPDAALKQAIIDALAKNLSKEIVATFSVEPGILGGTIVRVADRVMDGSVRRKLVRLRQQLTR